jgi:hypothetical protein
MWFSFGWVWAILGGLFVAGLGSAFLGPGMGAYGGPPMPAPGPFIGMGIPLFGAAVATVAVVHYFRRKG